MAKSPQIFCCFSFGRIQRSDSAYKIRAGNGRESPSFITLQHFHSSTKFPSKFIMAGKTPTSAASKVAGAQPKTAPPAKKVATGTAIPTKAVPEVAKVATTASSKTPKAPKK
ncbi:hypothetical protein B0H34DRAFT_716993 [Crassisporium funariophilum]|nr:hypothetical protein B0H34DRAFT_716993 [Crassisporium funariophilum]